MDSLLLISISISISCLMMFNLAVSNPTNLHPDIKEVCKATDDPALCESSVIPHLNGHTDPASVLTMHILTGIHATEEAIQIAKKALPSASRYDAELYKVCLETYDSALDSWKGAFESIKARQGFEVANDLSAVSSFISSCDDAFTNDDPTAPNNSPLARIDKLIMKMNSNCLAIRLTAFPE